MSKDIAIETIKPDWPAAKNIHAISTTRNIIQNTGSSEGLYACLNLAQHVEDNSAHVQLNRELLKNQLSLPQEPLWLDQVHGKQVANAGLPTGISADASYSLVANQVCAVMTADCLPVLICNRKGDKVAAAHAGWRGLVGGVIEATVESLDENVEELLVWLGPAIGPQAFEVGAEVRKAFTDDLAQSAKSFIENRPGHYLADIYQLARLRLNRIGIKAIYGGEHCTYTDADHFYSYRRDGKTGRQVSLIWFS